MSKTVIQTFLSELGYKKVRFVRKDEGQATTGWGVRWNPEQIARDLLQNFRDANRTNLGQVEVRESGSRVRISGPARCDLRLLYYMTTTKGEEDIGQFGEGFKAAVTCLLRDQRVQPVVVSGKDVLVISLSTSQLPNGSHPLLYEYFELLDTEEPGTVLYLEGCSRPLVVAVCSGMNHFLHDANPLIGPMLWRSKDGSFELRQSANPERGCVFYRGLLRAEIMSIPLVLIINRACPEVEELVGQDRDRNAFDAKVLLPFLSAFVATGVQRNEVVERTILQAARPIWPNHNDLLRILAESRGHTKWSPTTLKEVFGGQYFARTETFGYSFEIGRIEKTWQSEGRKMLPDYFSRFGLETAAEFVRDRDKRAFEEARQTEMRAPTKPELRAIQILREVLQVVSPNLMAHFGTDKVKYLVGKTETILGQLRQSRRYDSREVFLHAILFESDFARGLAVFVHEHAHMFGEDGSVSFSNALTEILEAMVRFRSQIDRHEILWNDARVDVAGERGQRSLGKLPPDILSAMAEMSVDELRELVELKRHGSTHAISEDHE